MVTQQEVAKRTMIHTHTFSHTSTYSHAHSDTPLCTHKCMKAHAHVQMHTYTLRATEAIVYVRDKRRHSVHYLGTNA